MGMQQRANPLIWMAAIACSLMLTANISQEMSQWQQTNNSLDPCIRSLMAVSPLHSPWKHWYDLLLPHLLHLIIVASGKPNKCS